MIDGKAEKGDMVDAKAETSIQVHEKGAKETRSIKGDIRLHYVCDTT